jgi:hypothetical protein
MIDLPHARALCDAATPGPWTTWGTAYDPKVFTSNGLLVADLPSYNDMHDAAFIAAARTLLPAALDELEKWQAPGSWGTWADLERERDTALATAAAWEEQARLYAQNAEFHHDRVEQQQATIEALVRACLNLTQLLPDKMHDEGFPGLAAFFAGDDHSAAALLAALGEAP